MGCDEASRRGASSVDFIKVQQLQSCRLQALFHDLSNPLVELITKITVAFGFLTETLPIQGNRSCGFDGSSVKTPTIGRNQPGPSQYFASSQGQNIDGAAF